MGRFWGLALVGFTVACGSEETETAPNTSVVSSTVGSGGAAGATSAGGENTGGAGGTGGQGGAMPLPCQLATNTFSAGLPAEPVCPETTCSDGAACSNIAVASPGSDLQMLADALADGDCLALEPGAYGDVSLPSGVSLLGRAASDVSVGAVAIDGGITLVRGITASGVSMIAGTLTLDRVVVTGSTTAGVIVDAGDVTVLDSCIHQNQNAGVYVTCMGDCGCPPAITVDMQRTLVSANANVGVWLDHAAATISESAVVESTPLNFEGGIGIYGTDCASLNATQVVVSDHASAGVYLLGGGATLGPDVAIARNHQGGVLACNVPSVSFSGFTIEDNEFFGLFIGAGSTGQLQSGTISNTILLTVPTPLGGIAMVGDAIQWVQDAELTVDATVQITQSGRAPAVIDASSNGTFNATLTGNDATVGVFLQNGAAPQIDPGIMQTQAVPPLHVVSCP